MANNLIIPFAAGAGANVPNDAAWASDPALAQGFQAGVAKSSSVNKALRQSTSVASGWGQFTADWSGQDFSDALSPATMETNFRIALAASLDGTRSGVDTSSAANQITFPLVPLPTTLNGIKTIHFKPNVTNTGATTITILNSGGTAAFPALPVKQRTGGDPVAGDLVAGTWYGAICDGFAFRLVSATKSEIAAFGGNITTIAQQLLANVKVTSFTNATSTALSNGQQVPLVWADPSTADFTNNGVNGFTVNTAGGYLIDLAGVVSTNVTAASSNDASNQILKNGTGLPGGFGKSPYTATGSGVWVQYVHAFTFAVLAAGDVIKPVEGVSVGSGFGNANGTGHTLIFTKLL